MVKQSDEELGAGKYTCQVKGILLVPINWDNMRPKQAREIEQESETLMQILADAKLNNIVYTVYTRSAFCAVQLINTWS